MSDFPKMVSCDSSNITHVGYAPETKSLHVRFNSGHYVYDDVPPSLFTALMSADSKGSFHHKHIKGKFASRKL